MPAITNVYCDESCHLEGDGHAVMVLGALWCGKAKAREIAIRLREIKAAHGLPPGFEVKWNKVSGSKAGFYQAILDYFFDDDDLHFRAWVAHKAGLNHAAFGQTHDDWYYKMMFQLVEPLLSPERCFHLYLDKKDTRSAGKVTKLHDVLCNNLYDFDKSILGRVQVVEANDVEQLQLADLLIGAVSYVNRGLSGNAGKDQIVARIRQRTNVSMLRPTLLREPKFNLFVWRGQGPTKETSP